MRKYDSMKEHLDMFNLIFFCSFGKKIFFLIRK